MPFHIACDFGELMQIRTPNVAMTNVVFCVFVFIVIYSIFGKQRGI